MASLQLAKLAREMGLARDPAMLYKRIVRYDVLVCLPVSYVSHSRDSSSLFASLQGNATNSYHL